MSSTMTGPSAEREWNGAAIGSLTEPLAALYGPDQDARRVVSDAGLDDLLPRINFDAAASPRWFGILDLARLRPGSVEAIIAVARREYPDDARLASALEAAAAPTRADAPGGALPAPAAVPAEVAESAAIARPLVDREDVVALLRSELEQINATRSGRALLLIGDSGVGKTRITECAVAAARELDMLVLEAQCVGAGAEPLLPLRDSLTSYRGQPTIQEILDEASAELRDYLPFVRSFLRIDNPGSSAPRLGGSADQGVYEGLGEVLLGLAGRRGLCIVVEDLTDADDDTLHFLDYFRRKAAPNRVLTLSTVKQDLVEAQLRDLIDKWEGDGCRVSEVPPLGPEDAAALVSLLWRGPPLADERIATIVEVTGGNPFFIEQYVGLTLEDASVADVPDRVEAVLRRRVRRLDEETRAFLDAAAVALEASNRLDLIAHVANVDDTQSVRLLRRAVEARCLAEDAGGGISFVQELLRRVVYEDVAAQSRLRMHGRAAEWLEENGLLSSAAHHYERAGRFADLVRTAMDGGARAEHAGLYRAALQLYERALPHGDLQVIGPRLAKAYIVVGEWQQADEVLDRLSADALDVRLLRAELLSVRGDFTRALEELELVLQTPSARRVETLIRLADVNLYLGELTTAAGYSKEALAEARDANTVARCQGGVGAAAFFAGRIDEGEHAFVDAMTVLSSRPVEERDQYVYTTILGNLGFANEVRGRWDAAKRFHDESLVKRREVSDARGVLQSLHAVARSEFGLGADESGLRSLDEARELAASLGERLEESKIEHTYAQLDLRQGRPASAVRRAETALRGFREAGTAYDVTHARFTLAAAFAANGAGRRAVEEGAKARIQMDQKGFGLLSTLFPQLAFSYGERIAAGLLGYAYGDAVGLPWEGRPPAEIDAAVITSLPARPEWPKGATSDDTALTLLVADHIVAEGRADGAGFLAQLAERAPSIKGLGPSTTQAIESFRRTGAPPVADGNTNGALMRALPIGWALPLDRVQDRRAWTIELSRATHPAPDACCAALVGSACAAWALEQAEPSLLLDVALEEVAAAQEAHGAGGRLEEMLSALAAGQWQPDPERLDLDPYETLTRVLWCIQNDPRLPDALLTAVRIGGDTDTVAALVGGLLACRDTPERVRAAVPWSGDVEAPDDALVGRLAAGIAALRAGRRSG
jgi:ADP-ribosylglycohydrolase/tetratricopeptide (TPR) repeat protein